jgi:ABC-2 type transport system ATP-binding protein
VLLSTHLRELAVQCCGTAVVLRGGARVAEVEADEMSGEAGAVAYRSLLD